MIDPNLPLLSVGLVAVGMAFVPAVRYEILKRDKWTCQEENCFGNYLGIGNLNWRRGFNLQASHEDKLHQKEPDRNPEHGKCRCWSCHLIQEIKRGNHGGARLLYEGHTMRNSLWLPSHEWKDQKAPLQFYYDFANADEEGRQGLIQAYIERFDITDNLFDADYAELQPSLPTF